jgi:hypothetical protein
MKLTKKKKLLSLLGCFSLTAILATAAIQPAQAGARFSEEGGGNLPGVRIREFRVSYCMDRAGCSKYTVERAAHAFCQYRGYSRATEWTWYRSPKQAAA